SCPVKVFLPVFPFHCVVENGVNAVVRKVQDGAFRGRDTFSSTKVLKHGPPYDTDYRKANGQSESDKGNSNRRNPGMVYKRENEPRLLQLLIRPICECYFGVFECDFQGCIHTISNGVNIEIVPIFGPSGCE